MRKSLISTVLAAALVCSPLALAASNPASTNTTTNTPAQGRHARHAKHAMSMLDQLDLTAAQRTSIQQVLRQNFEQARPEMQALRQKELAFENATPGSATYQSATNDLAQAQSDAAHARVLREAALRTHIYDELTPAQRTKLADIRKQHQAKMGQ